MKQGRYLFICNPKSNDFFRLPRGSISQKLICSLSWTSRLPFLHVYFSRILSANVAGKKIFNKLDLCSWRRRLLISVNTLPQSSYLPLNKFASEVAILLIIIHNISFEQLLLIQILNTNAFYAQITFESFWV